MSSESLMNPDENIYNSMSESQTLDSLLQSTCDTPSQSESSDVTHNIECKPASVPELFRKRSHSESMNLYINTLKPKDVIMFIEDIKYFSYGTAFMNDFRTSYIDPILKYLNGGDPLKNDFGRDPHTSAYSLFVFTPLKTFINDTCRDTVRIIQIMEALDNLKFQERNLNKMKISMKNILEKSRDEFLYFDKYRNNHPKRKRYLIYIFHSDVCLDDIDDVVKDLNSMKVRFSAFGVFKHESCIKLSEALNYNNKGCKDLSCFGRTDRWPISLSNGLYKYFETSKLNQGKNTKWTNSKEQSDSNEVELLNFMNSTGPPILDNTIQNINNCVSDNQINTIQNVRPMTLNDTIDSNYSQPSGNLIGSNQNLLPHTNIQTKYAQASNHTYYPNASCQSEISKSNQIPYFSSPDQFYPISSSVNMTSHRLTPSILPSQSPQFHTMNPHSQMSQNSLYNDQLKPNNTEIPNEIISPMSNLSNQSNATKVNQINQEIEMGSVHRYPNNNMSFNVNNSINTTNFNQNRFMPRQSYYSTNPKRNNGIILFDGIMQYNDENTTEFRIHLDQSIDLSLLNMNSWENKCRLQYVNYVEGYQLNIYGKHNGEIENADISVKSAIEVKFQMNPIAQESITTTISSKPLIAVILPYRNIPLELHIHCICILFNRSTSTIKVLIPADPRSLINEIRNRHQPTSYTSGQSNSVYNQMKRNNFVPSNQSMYAMTSNVNMQRPIGINRYNSGNNMPMLSVTPNPNYRTIAHPSTFINSQQMSPGYILHQGQYAANSNQTQSGSYQIPMDMNMQSNQNIYDQNSYL